VSLIARALQVSRSNLMRPVATHPRPQRQSKEGPAVLEAVKAIVGGRPSYGYRRATAMLNRERRRAGEAPVNHKRIYRLMAANQLLLERHTGKPVRTHEGKVVTLKSDLRWCSDSLEVRCWNWEKVHLTFVLDCCDREVIAFRASREYPTGETARDLMAESVERRFGREARTVPHGVEWLTDNGPIYTAHETREFGRSLGLLVCTTPAYSPESNGMAEAFVKTFKRDYAYVNELTSAASVLAAVPLWMADYNESHPHRGLGMKSPREYRAAVENAGYPSPGPGAAEIFTPNPSAVTY
jgi:putative transposase